MSSSEIEMIVADEPYFVPLAVDEPNLLRETNLSFRAWLAESSEAVKEIAFEGTLRVDAYVAGLIRSDEGNLILSAGGTIDGDLFVRDALINGTVRGDIQGTHRVELGSSARVIGDIETAQLIIRPGASFQGRCAFTPEAASAREAA